MHRCWAVWQLSLLPLLTACSALAPPPAPLPPATPPAWLAPLPEGAAAAAAGAALAADDPLLAELQAAARRASPTLAEAAERIAAAQAALVAARASRQPLAEASGSASRARNTPDLPIAESFSVGVMARWEIDLFGRLAVIQSGAQDRADAAALAWHDGRVSLDAEISGAYVQYRACEALLGLAVEDSRSRAETARLTGLTARAGFAAPADAELAHASAAQARNQQEQTALACERQIKALVALLAWDEAQLRQKLAERAGRLPAFSPLVPAELPAQLLVQRPDLIEAQARLRAALADVREQQLDRVPKIVLNGSIGAARSGRSDGITWSLGPLQLSLPVLEGGVSNARIRAARQAADSARVQLDARLRDAVRDVEQALLSLAASSRRQADAEAAAAGFEAALQATQARQRSGLASLFELEDARRQALAARNALVELQRDRSLAWIGLYRALGGGWTREATAALPPPG